MRNLKETLKVLLNIILPLLLLTQISCTSLKSLKVISPKASKGSVLKRSWVRRLAPAKSLRTNEIAQNFSPLLKSNGNVVQASSYGGLFEVTKRGRKVWSHDVEDGISGSGSIHKNFVFFGGQDRKLYGFNANSEEVIWSTALDSEVSSISDFRNGKIYVLTSQGGLYAIKAADGVIDWKISYPPRKSLKIYGGAKPVLVGERVIAGFPNGVVASFSQSSGKIGWETKLEGSQKYEDVDFLSHSSDGYLVAGVFDVAVFRLNLKTGQILWQAYEQPVSEPAIYNGNLYFSSAKGELISLGLSTGNLISKEKVFKGLGGKPLFIQGGMVVTDSKGPVRFFSSKGDVLSDYDLASGTSSDLTLSRSKNKFFLFSDKGYLYSFGLR